MAMEKLDLDETQEFEFAETDGPDTGLVTGTLEDDTYVADNEDLHEQFAFVEEMLGEGALQDKRNTYGMKTDQNNYPEFTYEYGGKTLAVRHDRIGTLWSICFVEGGQLPGDLDGSFTSQDEAKHAVTQFLAK